MSFRLHPNWYKNLFFHSLSPADFRTYPTSSFIARLRPLKEIIAVTSQLLTWITNTTNPTLWRGGTRWRSWLRHCATSRKVSGSIPDGVIGIFHWHNPSSCTKALGLIQPLTKTGNRKISWGVNAVGEYGWQPYHHSLPTVLKSGSLNLLEPSGPVQACIGCALPFTYVIM
jgi:hypothetical protein